MRRLSASWPGSALSFFCLLVFTARLAAQERVTQTALCKRRSLPLPRSPPPAPAAAGMLAGGTGIAPMYQVLQCILKNPNDNTEVRAW